MCVETHGFAKIAWDRNWFFRTREWLSTVSIIMGKNIQTLSCIHVAAPPEYATPSTSLKLGVLES